MVCLKFPEDKVGRALAQIEPTAEVGRRKSAMSLPMVSLASLEGARDSAICTHPAAGDGQELLLLRLFSIILGECGNVREEMDAALEEFGHTQKGDDKGVDPTDMRYIGSSSRKIFMDEEPNPFKENLVTCQLAMSMLVNAPPSGTARPDKSLREVVAQIWARSLAVIKAIRPNQGQLGGVSSMTYRGSTKCSPAPSLLLPSTWDILI